MPANPTAEQFAAYRQARQELQAAEEALDAADQARDESGVALQEATTVHAANQVSYSDARADFRQKRDAANAAADVLLGSDDEPMIHPEAPAG